jgi:hypothetical protein
MQKAWLAVVTWIDGDVYDADEIRVFAETADQAKSAAREGWSATIGAGWPHCRIEEIEVIPQSMLHTLALG